MVFKSHTFSIHRGLGGRLKSVGSEVGIDFTYKAERFPNTLRAHALLEYAKQVDGGSKQNDVAELLFKVSGSCFHH